MDDGKKFKFCPGCEENVELDPAFWPTRRVKRVDGTFREGPAGYCRRCSNKRNTKRQLDRRHGVPPKRARCDICGLIRTEIQYLDPTAIDLAYPPMCVSEKVTADTKCLTRLGLCAWQLDRAKDWDAIYSAHMEEEATRDLDWRADRRRPAHLGIKDPPSFSHFVCVEEATAWSGIVAFLTRQERLRNARTAWDRAAIGDLYEESLNGWEQKRRMAAKR